MAWKQIPRVIFIVSSFITVLINMVWLEGGQDVMKTHPELGKEQTLAEFFNSWRRQQPDHDNSNKKLDGGNDPLSSPSSECDYRGQRVDILSVASNSRPLYYETQQRTWANHPLVRNFFVITESNDTEPACVNENLPNDKAMQVPKYCKRRHSFLQNYDNTTWFMNRVSHLYANPQWLAKKKNPAGWICAQKRFPMGLSNAVSGMYDMACEISQLVSFPSSNMFANLTCRGPQGYLERGEPFPDYLVVVDDDTYYNMDIFYSTVMLSSRRRSASPYVAAGCRIRRANNFLFPFGGYGLAFSKGSLELLSRPIDITKPPKDEWEKAAQSWLTKQNAIFERDSFTNGMSLADLIKTFVMEEPFENVENWTRGYCFHGHFLFSYFIEHYKLGMAGLDTMLDSEIVHRSGTPKITNQCLNEYSNCSSSSSLVCHYQTPQDMERLDSEHK